MSIDGIVVRALTHELQQLIGARIQKIQQPNTHDLVMHLRGTAINYRILLSANPTYPRVHFTEQQAINPLTPPMFLTLMRKHTEGGIIEAIEQVENERIIHFVIRQRDELGDLKVKRLILEIMGRHSNLILTNESSGTIIDGIHHVTPSISQYRVIMPGVTYVAPPSQHKQNPFAIESPEQFRAALATDDFVASDKIAMLLVDAFGGVSPQLATVLVQDILRDRDYVSIESYVKFVYPSFKEHLDRYRNHEYAPHIGQIGAKSTFALHSLPGGTAYSSVNACLDAFYADKAERDAVKQRAADLLKFASSELAKNEKKISKLQLTLKEAENADQFRIAGELLTAYMHQLSRGDKYADIINYYEEDQPVLRIELDPQLSPSDNAQRYYRRYTKAKNSIQAVREQLKNTKIEIDYFRALSHQLATSSLQDLDEIRDELVSQGYLRARLRSAPRKSKPDKKSAKPVLLLYTSSEGVPIYVGKNNTQNEYVTNKLAASHDTWLHTKDIPGSHVVIRAAQSEFGNPTLEEAAMLAAHYSQARDSSLIPVDYTLIRHVKKPSGAKPGYVIYDHQQTLYITPDVQRINTMPCRTT